MKPLSPSAKQTEFGNSFTVSVLKNCAKMTRSVMILPALPVPSDFPLEYSCRFLLGFFPQYSGVF